MIPLFTSSVAAAATYGQVPSLADLERLSRAVVVGHVVSAVTEPAPWGLVTTYDVAVDEVLDGEAGGSVRVQLPGGRRAGLVQRWSGVPQWVVGDAVLVFVPRAGVLPLSGVFTVVDGAVVDPLERGEAWTVSALSAQVRGRSSLSEP